jgi:hypothetical protein
MLTAVLLGDDREEQLKLAALMFMHASLSRRDDAFATSGWMQYLTDLICLCISRWSAPARRPPHRSVSIHLRL